MPLAWRPQVRDLRPRNLVALVSRAMATRPPRPASSLSIGTLRTASSAVYLVCLIASGEADVYVRCGPTMEWDTAAGDHILTRAGGCVIGAGGGS